MICGAGPGCGPPLSCSGSCDRDQLVQLFKCSSAMSGGCASTDEAELPTVRSPKGLEDVKSRAVVSSLLSTTQPIAIQPWISEGFRGGEGAPLRPRLEKDPHLRLAEKLSASRNLLRSSHGIAHDTWSAGVGGLLAVLITCLESALPSIPLSKIKMKYTLKELASCFAFASSAHLKGGPPILHQA